MLPTEQMSEALIKTLINKYAKLGEHIFHPFAVSNSTERTFMLLPENLRLLLVEKKPYCEAHAMVELLEVFGRQILNEESDITGLPQIL